MGIDIPSGNDVRTTDSRKSYVMSSGRQEISEARETCTKRGMILANLTKDIEWNLIETYLRDVNPDTFYAIDVIVKESYDGTENFVWSQDEEIVPERSGREFRMENNFHNPVNGNGLCAVVRYRDSDGIFVLTRKTCHGQGQQLIYRYICQADCILPECK